jgi:hypothetical protein
MHANTQHSKIPFLSLLLLHLGHTRLHRFVFSEQFIQHQTTDAIEQPITRPMERGHRYINTNTVKHPLQHTTSSKRLK